MALVQVRNRWWVAPAPAVLALSLLAASPASGASAAGLAVNTTADGHAYAPASGTCETAPGNGQCTLRAAMEVAGALGGSSTITLPGGVYNLSVQPRPLPQVTANLTIAGAGIGASTIDAQHPSPATGSFLDVAPTGNLALRDLGLQGGLAILTGGAVSNRGHLSLSRVLVSGNAVGEGAGPQGHGGGIYNQGDLAIADSFVKNNFAAGLSARGGGVYNAGNLTVQRSVIELNRTSGTGASDQGAGLFSAANAQLTDSTIASNTSGGGATQGSGIYSSGTLTVTRSTVSGNSGAGGGGLEIAGGTASLINATVAQNQARTAGGGLESSAGATTLVHVTLGQNSAPTGANLNNLAGTVALRGSIVAGGVGGPNCAGSFASEGYDLDSAGSCGFVAAGDRVNADPRLGPLAANGGPTQTQALLPGSAAIDGVTAGCPPPTTDQRGFTRPQGPFCDMGAYEVVPAAQDPPVGPYTPVPPFRVFDSRTSIPLGANQTVDVAVAGLGSVAASAAAVVVNVTATNASATSYVTVYPAGAASRPTASTINFVAGESRANLATVATGAGGRLTLYNSEGSVDVILDAVGWYAGAPAGGTSGRHRPLASPVRIMDTRPASQIGPYSSPLGANSSVSLQIGGTALVPNASTAAVVNVTAVNGTHDSYLTVSPSGVTQSTSSVNFATGRNVPNRAVVKLGESGAIDVYNSEGSVDVVIDLAGWFADGTDLTVSADMFHPLPPARILDSRPGLQVGPYSTPWGPNQSRSVVVTGTGGIPASAHAIVVNVTATNATAGTFVTLYPGPEGTVPLASDLNVGPGETRANLGIVRLDAGGRLSLYNNLGYADLVVDVAGWF